MATLRAEARVAGENEPILREGKIDQAGVQGGVENRRRALGDIGNIHGVTTRAQAAKEKAATKNSGALRARDPNATAAALRARATATTKNAKLTGVSLSSLLQNRSEAAAVSKSPVAPPPSPIPDIDSRDKGDPLSAYEYAGSIYNYYRRVEPRFQVQVDYMSNQVEITEKMRSILIDWLIEVHLKFKLMPETLYLTCNLIDRYLAVRNVARKRLQLVGVTAMLIASKYEEIWAPEVRDFVYISDQAYTREEILAMEKQMLQVLTYDLTVPTSYNFLARFKKAAGVASSSQHLKVHQVAEYLAELSMVDIKMLAYPVSMVSAACLHLALLATGYTDTYPYALRKHARYSLDDIMPCCRHLAALWQRSGSSNLKAVHKKYSNVKYGQVAQHTTVPVPELPEAAP